MAEGAAEMNFFVIRELARHLRGSHEKFFGQAMTLGVEGIIRSLLGPSLVPQITLYETLQHLCATFHEETLLTFALHIFKQVINMSESLPTVGQFLFAHTTENIYAQHLVPTVAATGPVADVKARGILQQCVMPHYYGLM